MLQANRYPRQDIIVSPQVTVIFYKETFPSMRELSIHTERKKRFFFSGIDFLFFFSPSKVLNANWHLHSLPLGRTFLSESSLDLYCERCGTVFTTFCFLL